MLSVNSFKGGRLLSVPCRGYDVSSGFVACREIASGSGNGRCAKAPSAVKYNNFGRFHVQG